MEVTDRSHGNSIKTIRVTSDPNEHVLTTNVNFDFSRTGIGESMNVPVYLTATRHFWWMTKCVATRCRKWLSRTHLLPALLLLSVICTFLYFTPAFAFSQGVYSERNSTAPKMSSLRALNQYIIGSIKSLSPPKHQMARQSIVKEQNRFPSCIIFGVSKSGTRAVCEYLKLHPDVVAPSAEIHFFDNITLQREKGVNWYLQQMPRSKPNQITVEKSPDYFQHPQSAELIYKTNRGTKLLLLLRDPVERLISQYMQLVEKNPSLPFFEQWVIDPNTGRINVKQPSILVSAYSKYLVDWLKIFPREQIHIIESDSLRVNPLAEMKLIEKFLNIRPYFIQSDFYFNISRGFYCNRIRATGKTKCLGKSKGRAHITVRKEILDKLREFYLPYNQELNRLLNMKFPWS